MRQIDRVVKTIRKEVKKKCLGGNRYSRRDPSARNHFHRSSFAGKDYGESTKGDVDLDVTSRLNYSGGWKVL
jgi:hypothetical protein